MSPKRRRECAGYQQIAGGSLARVLGSTYGNCDIWVCNRLMALEEAHFPFMKVTTLLTPANSSCQLKMTIRRDNLGYLYW